MNLSLPRKKLVEQLTPPRTLVLRLERVPMTASVAATAGSGGVLMAGRRSQVSLLRTGRTTLALKYGRPALPAGVDDYDALQIGSNNLLIGPHRLIAIP